MKSKILTSTCAFAALLTSSLIPATMAADESKPLSATASAGKSYGATVINGKAVTFVRAHVKVQLQGGDAQKAFAVGQVKADPATIDGKIRTPEVPQDRYELINRLDSSSPHPNDGVGITLSYGEITETSKTIDAVKGTVEVLIGGVEKEVIIDKLSSREDGSVKSPVLTAGKLKIDFERTSQEDGMTAVSIMIDKKDKASISGIHLIGADGKPSANSPSNGWFNDMFMFQYWLDDATLKSGKIKVIIRQDWKREVLPFELKNVEIK